MAVPGENDGEENDAQTAEKLFRERQRQNFQASSALDGLQVEVVTLDNEQIAQRLAELRGHYER